MDEFNLSYDIAITKKNNSSDSLVFWITSWAGGTRKSTSFGATWQRVLLPPDAFNTITPTGGPYNFELNPRDRRREIIIIKDFLLPLKMIQQFTLVLQMELTDQVTRGMSWKKYNYDSTGSGTGVSGDFVVGLDVQKYGNHTVIWGSTNVTKTG